MLAAKWQQPDGIAEIAGGKSPTIFCCHVAARTGTKRRTGLRPAATVLAANVLPNGTKNGGTEEDETRNLDRSDR
jgi:hypothetical protein